MQTTIQLPKDRGDKKSELACYSSWKETIRNKNDTLFFPNSTLRMNPKSSRGKKNLILIDLYYIFIVGAPTHYFP